MGKTNGSHIKDGLPKPPFQAIIGACAGESYIRLHVAAEGVDALKSLRQQGLHIEIKHLESGVSQRYAHRRGEGRLNHHSDNRAKQ